MTVNDILTLAQAGFIREEISRMAAALPGGDPAPAQADPEPAPAQADPEPAPAQADPEPPPQTSPEDALMAELLNLKQLVINGNVNSSRMPAEDPGMTADSILASIINPYKEEK